jgi:predicted RNA-binding Zn-ribbon protein involved in translation (DUF1610 family)
MNDVAIIKNPMELSVLEVKNQIQKIHTLMTECMKQGEHYGHSFPGDTKKNLLKPGADKLMFMFRLRPDFHQDVKELPGGHREVFTKCEIYHIESGKKIAEGVGSASTMESKYRWRNTKRKCPSCGKETIIKGKEEYGGGWICHKKQGGCGVKFTDEDPAITNQAMGKVENTDIADTYNTVLKISKKRAYVDAAITSCAASDIFTQDADDLPTDEPPDNGETNNNPDHDKSKSADTGASLAKDAARGAKEPQINPFKERGKKLIAELGDIMTSRNNDELDYFTDEERHLVSDFIKTVNVNAQGIAMLEGAVQKWGEALEERRAAYKPIPFEDGRE